LIILSLCIGLSCSRLLLFFINFITSTFFLIFLLILLATLFIVMLFVIIVAILLSSLSFLLLLSLILLFLSLACELVLMLRVLLDVKALDFLGSKQHHSHLPFLIILICILFFHLFDLVSFGLWYGSQLSILIIIVLLQLFLLILPLFICLCLLLLVFFLLFCLLHGSLVLDLLLAILLSVVDEQGLAATCSLWTAKLALGSTELALHDAEV